MAAMFLSLLVLMSYGSNYTIVSNTTYNDEAVFSNVIQSDYKEICSNFTFKDYSILPHNAWLYILIYFLYKFNAQFSFSAACNLI